MGWRGLKRTKWECVQRERPGDIVSPHSMRQYCCDVSSNYCDLPDSHTHADRRRMMDLWCVHAFTFQFANIKTFEIDLQIYTKKQRGARSGRKIPNNHNFNFFSVAVGNSQTLPPSLCHQSCSWMPNWPHDGFSLRVFPRRAAGNVVSCKCFRVAALKAERHNTQKHIKNLKEGNAWCFLLLCKVFILWESKIIFSLSFRTVSRGILREDKLSYRSLNSFLHFSCEISVFLV